jgi:archaellum component FlaC
MAEHQEMNERLESLKRELSTLRYDGVSNYTEDGKAMVRRIETAIKEFEKDIEQQQ